MSERGRAGPLQGLPSSPFLPGHISHFADGDDHTKADAASVASNGAGDEVKASADDFDDGLFQRSCHAPWPRALSALRSSVTYCLIIPYYDQDCEDILDKKTEEDYEDY